MKILEFMSFNPGWFLTLPGILITSGVILLLIALILLLTSAKKEEEEQQSSTTTTLTTNNVETVAQPEPIQVNVPSAPVEEKTVTIEQPTMQTIEERPTNQPVEQAPSNNMGVGILDIANNNIKPVVEEPVMPSKVETPGVLNINEGTVQQTKVQEEIPSININKVETPVVNNENVVPTIPIQEEIKPIINTEEIKPQPVSIYGGVSPTSDINKENLQPEKPVIYGGADPLENTAPIPTVAHPAYSTVASTPQPMPATPSVVNEAKLVDPIATPEVITPTAVVDTTTNDTISAAPGAISDVETLEL